ncbi:MAG TPA: globin [Acidimicrobiia bacterium]|nr:globin [Acidimicrobiia bacterium]
MEIAPTPERRHPWGDAATPYHELGGDDAVRALVEAFYDLIEAESPVLRAMLPSNTATSRQKLYEFLSGWLGGPPLYMERRGHPRLRLRHMPFDIGSFEASEWMLHDDGAGDCRGRGSALRLPSDRVGSHRRRDAKPPRSRGDRA